MRDVLVAILVGLAAALQVLAALGVLVVRDPFDRLHYTSPPAYAGVLVAAAVAVELGPSIATEKAVLLALLLVATSPIAVQVMARATRAAAGEDADDIAAAERG
jgi:multisubunit Na+/H+ antiporter MnhG subunit